MPVIDSHDDYVLAFPATLPEYEKAFEDLRQALERHGVQEKGRYNVELVFEEIVTNVIRHGSLDRTDCAVEVSVGFKPGAVVITFSDNARPFDPITHEFPESPDESIEEARIGGLGLILVRKACASMEYKRTPQDRNHLVVTITDA